MKFGLVFFQFSIVQLRVNVLRVKSDISFEVTKRKTEPKLYSEGIKFVLSH